MRDREPHQGGVDRRPLGCDGPADLLAIENLQAGLRLSPLGDSGALAGVPADDAGLDGEQAFLASLAAWSQAFPPGDADLEY
jgi:hypothetical protein